MPTKDADLVRQAFDLARKRQGAAAEAVLREALAQRPEDPFLGAALARLYLRLGRTAASRALVEEQASRTDLSAAQRAEVLALSGEVALKEQRWGEAVEQLEAAHALRPDAFLAGRLAEAYRRSGRLEEARALVERVEGFHDDPHLLRLLARIREEQGDPAAALESYRRLTELDASDDFAQAAVIRLSQQGSSQEERAADLARVLRVGRRGDNPQLHQLYARELSGLGKDADAAAELERAVKLAPEDPFLLAQAAYAHRRAGESQRAWELLRRALNVRPADRPAQLTFTALSRELSLEAEAAGFVRELLELHPQAKSLWQVVRRLEHPEAPPPWRHRRRKPS